MKFRRLTPVAFGDVKSKLDEVIASGSADLGPYLEDNANAVIVPELAEADFDPERIFPHSYEAAEYFCGILSQHMNPAPLLKDAEFWTWLALVYLKQFASIKNGKLHFGDISRIQFKPDDYTSYYRHLLAGPFGVYYAYKDSPQVCKAVLWNRMNKWGDVQEQLMSKQAITQNPAFMTTINRLYFDETKQELKRGAGGKDKGSPRRFCVAVDQFGLTKDFFDPNDAELFLAILPKEFNRFNPLRAEEWRRERQAAKAASAPHSKKRLGKSLKKK